MLQINVNGKIATYSKRGGDIVCGNSDYKIHFTFDSSWKNAATKYARFIWNGEYTDVPIDSSGNVTVPRIENTDQCLVGVYATNMYTSTPAIIPCRRSIHDIIAKERII